MIPLGIIYRAIRAFCTSWCVWFMRTAGLMCTDPVMQIYAGSPYRFQQLNCMQLQLEHLGEGVIGSRDPRIAALFALPWHESNIGFYANRGRYYVVEWRHGAFDALRRPARVSAVSGTFEQSTDIMLPIMVARSAVTAIASEYIECVLDYLQTSDRIRVIPMTPLSSLSVDSAMATAILCERVESFVMPSRDVTGLILVGNGLIVVDSDHALDDGNSRIAYSVIATHNIDMPKNRRVKFHSSLVIDADTDRNVTTTAHSHED